MIRVETHLFLADGSAAMIPEAPPLHLERLLPVGLAAYHPPARVSWISEAKQGNHERTAHMGPVIKDAGECFVCCCGDELDLESFLPEPQSSNAQ